MYYARDMETETDCNSEKKKKKHGQTWHKTQMWGTDVIIWYYITINIFCQNESILQHIPVTFYWQVLDLQYG